MGTMTFGRVSSVFWGSTSAHLLRNLSSSTVLTLGPSPVQVPTSVHSRQ